MFSKQNILLGLLLANTNQFIISLSGDFVISYNANLFIKEGSFARKQIAKFKDEFFQMFIETFRNKIFLLPSGLSR